jgi:hypothetical protein
VPESLEKLRPDRDLQCYFFQPSAIAALSAASAGGFTVSGCWRQQFDWAVVEWNRDNVYEHPLLRNLPDGDLSGLTLTYKETRTNCIAMDSGLFPTVDWPYLRIWAPDGSGAEQVYKVPLFSPDPSLTHAIPAAGSYANAQATFTLGGTLTPGDFVELSWLDEHYYHIVAGGDTFSSVLAALAGDINAISKTVSAAPLGENQIVLTNLSAGAEGNLLGVLALASGPAPTEQWSPGAQLMSGGASPSQWQVTLNFGSLLGTALLNPPPPRSLTAADLTPVPTRNIRKMRWTYSAALQPQAYQRSEFSVVVSGWSVSGSNRSYVVAGPQSRRIEDDDASVAYTGPWTSERGSYSGGTIRSTSQTGAECSLSYRAQRAHRLYLGTRSTGKAGIAAVSVDGGQEQAFDLFVPQEDFVRRLDLGSFGAGGHTFTARLTGANPNSGGQDFYFDFLELAVPANTVSAQPAAANETLATDWDTNHSLSLAPERVAWNLQMLGFTGRANHYAGALRFYELVNPANAYAQAAVTFQGSPALGQVVQIAISGTTYSRVTLTSDTLASVAKAFEYMINNGSTGVWAEAAGNVLTLHARAPGKAGEALTLSATASAPSGGTMQAAASGAAFAGGLDGAWLTDLAATPRLNRAARDWHGSYFAALKGYGIDAAAAFSMELGNADGSAAAGIAQRYPDGQPVEVGTPALQTNFSPPSLNFWKQVYLDMAGIMDAARLTPYLQFGEVQWWYFPGETQDPATWTHGGMTFYDGYTASTFQAQYGRPMHVFSSNSESPAPYPEESAFLPGLIGTFTTAIAAFVKAAYPGARFEVLYPPDVNNFPLTKIVNLPGAGWGPSDLTAFKTENFSFTAARNLNLATASIVLPLGRGFARSGTAHLVGVGDSSQPWDWERRLAHGEQCESVVLFAFDQFSMIGYGLPLAPGARRSGFIG